MRLGAVRQASAAISRPVRPAHPGAEPRGLARTWPLGVAGVARGDSARPIWNERSRTVAGRRSRARPGLQRGYIYIYIYIYLYKSISLSLSLYIYIYIYTSSWPSRAAHGAVRRRGAQRIRGEGSLDSRRPQPATDII